MVGEKRNGTNNTAGRSLLKPHGAKTNPRDAENGSSISPHIYAGFIEFAIVNIQKGAVIAIAGPEGGFFLNGVSEIPRYRFTAVRALRWKNYRLDTINLDR